MSSSFVGESQRTYPQGRCRRWPRPRRWSVRPAARGRNRGRTSDPRRRVSATRRSSRLRRSRCPRRTSCKTPSRSGSLLGRRYRRDLSIRVAGSPVRRSRTWHGVDSPLFAVVALRTVRRTAHVEFRTFVARRAAETKVLRLLILKLSRHTPARRAGAAEAEESSQDAVLRRRVTPSRAVISCAAGARRPGVARARAVVPRPGDAIK